MKYKVLISLLLIFVLCVFSVFIYNIHKEHEVLIVYNPVKLGIDLNRNKVIDNDEIVCVEGMESFSLYPDDSFVDKYSKTFNINYTDFVSLGFLAQEFTEKSLLNKNVTLKFNSNNNSECRFAKIFLFGTNYSDILYNSGYGIKNGKIGSVEKFEKELERSKNLNLVILNHKSNKFHTLTCEYGHAAHDKIILPFKHLPKDAIPCRYCLEHMHNKKFKTKDHAEIVLKEPPIVVSQGDITVYHTNFVKNLKPNRMCDTSECKLIVNLIENAQKSIDIAIYGYDEIPRITDALKTAAKNGVEIRFVYDSDLSSEREFYHSNDVIKNIATTFKSDKINADVQSSYIMHNKFLIIDDSTVLTGSMNFSPSGLSGYDQNDVIVIKSFDIALLYKKEFEQMLGGKFHNHKIKLDFKRKFVIGNSEIEIYFSPKDKTSARLIKLINNAKSYIYIPTFLITHKDITNALISAKSRGVDVKILMDANSVHTRNTKHTILRQNGVLLKTENMGGKLHSKAMIIDDEYVVIGSMNFSNSGENKNDENTVIIKNSNIAHHYKDLFLYLWKSVPDKYLTSTPRAEGKDSIGSCTDGIDNNFDGKIDKDDDGCK